MELFDPTLALASDALDDIEKIRIANENRLRQLTRSVEDKDGEVRGLGLDPNHPSVKRLSDIVDGLLDLEDDSTANLQKIMKVHPLGPWITQQKGIGFKQMARLLGAIGDPAVRPEFKHKQEDGSVILEPSRPRGLYELNAYCGYSVVDGAAPRKQKGQLANWSQDARKRLWLISNSIVKAGGPYRVVYDEAKAKYQDAKHKVECPRCTPAGKPAAEVGSPLKPSHIHTRALRAISKRVLKDLWLESRRLHGFDDDDRPWEKDRVAS